MKDETENFVIENETNSHQESLVRWVTFQLGDETYGIDIMKVKEVLRITEIAPVPGAVDYIVGIINLRGNVVTIVDGRKRLALPPHEMDDATRIVIVEADDQVAGVVVDSVTGVVDMPLSAVDSTPHANGTESSRYIDGVTTYEDELIIMLDIGKLLTDQPWDTAAGF